MVTSASIISAAEIQNMMGRRCSCVWPPPLAEVAETPDRAKAATNTKGKKKRKAKRRPMEETSAGFANLTAEQRESIQGRIYVSNADAGRDYKLLTALNVSLVISVGGGRGAEGVVRDFLHFGIKDRMETDYLPVLREASDFASAAIAAGRSVLVHCQGGMHRSPTVAAALLIRHARLTSVQARWCVQAARPTAAFGEHLFAQLDSYEEECHARESDSLIPPAEDADQSS